MLFLLYSLTISVALCNPIVKLFPERFCFGIDFSGPLLPGIFGDFSHNSIKRNLLLFSFKILAFSNSSHAFIIKIANVSSR